MRKLQAARAFLEYLYAEDRSTVLTVEKAELVSLLAHKYGLHDTLQCCDEFLASRVNIDGSSWELWGDDVSKAVHMLAVAEAHSLPSLAERAERYILKNGNNLSAIPEIHRISSECLDTPELGKVKR
ncbi:hypothetical protein COCSUDRAFT_59957 [Coccomyxa subellipsoidea C-169]|uniref:BTB domain-containing protein n=1 Tax=Coccomyxa subellipsoidea (strain C-169) TaxID=574566 RepID=I0YJS9_COCSC|nr:hypothetical protein COCSUDRAFT_59957 [Coccomyxa subellipsoidea C-169]EIE18648.1 hypothetical protein COCSUDRAFT_59957 [Coccomyxa subellipsoidea C-169]|eukprot:XP_005643192.1 hypothetical protein COCSUDRAFT_59957 [Coccomyxa subellipsoidea C-169]